MGPYPLLCCHRWAALRQDLEANRDQLVTFSAVTDPFGAYLPTRMQAEFSIFKPFKRHFIVDLRVPADSRTDKHHRREIKRATKRLCIEYVRRPLDILAEWLALYGVLIDRHAIRGIPAFSPEIFRHQLAVPGMLAFRALLGTETIGVALWYRSGEFSYYHLAAYNDSGYLHGASYALFLAAFEQLSADGVRWVNLGAGAGAEGDTNDGLTRFKAGWATETRVAYFCGEVFDREVYQRLATANGRASSNYFPAYRSGDFH